MKQTLVLWLGWCLSAVLLCLCNSLPPGISTTLLRLLEDSKLSCNCTHGHATLVEPDYLCTPNACTISCSQHWQGHEQKPKLEIKISQDRLEKNSSLCFFVFHSKPESKVSVKWFGKQRKTFHGKWSDTRTENEWKTLENYCSRSLKKLQQSSLETEQRKKGVTIDFSTVL